MRAARVPRARAGHSSCRLEILSAPGEIYFGFYDAPPHHSRFFASKLLLLFGNRSRTIFNFGLNFVLGTPINRLPIMAKQVLDLYELYNLVIARGGLVDVINKKLWQEIIKGLHLPSSITSAAFTLRTQ